MFPSNVQSIESLKRILADESSSLFSKLVAQYLLENGLTQGQFATAVDLERSYVSRIMNGSRTPKSDRIPKIAEFLGIDEEELVLVLAGYDPLVYRKRVLQQAEQRTSDT